jgi:hypothetical protein
LHSREPHTLTQSKNEVYASNNAHAMRGRVRPDGLMQQKNKKMLTEARFELAPFQTAEVVQIET